MNDGYNWPSWYSCITLSTGSHLTTAAPRNHMIAICNLPCQLPLNSMGSCQEKMQETGESLPIHTSKLLCAYTSYLHNPTYPPQTLLCLPITCAPPHTLPEPRCLTLSHILPEFCHASPSSCYSFPLQATTTSSLAALTLHHSSHFCTPHALPYPAAVIYLNASLLVSHL